MKVAAGWLLRGFCQVSLVAANVRFIAADSTLPMLVTGFAISWVWFSSAQHAGRGGLLNRWAYALGAMLGTWVGSRLGGWL